MKVLTEKRARQICSYWHDGQWSALYQYSSSGIVTPCNKLDYLNETFASLQPEYHATHPRELKQSEIKELTSLLNYFQHKLTDYKIIKHPDYGYKMAVAAA